MLHIFWTSRGPIEHTLYKDIHICVYLCMYMPEANTFIILLACCGFGGADESFNATNAREQGHKA